MSEISYYEKRLTGKTFGAEIHGFTGPEEKDEKMKPDIKVCPDADVK